MKAQASARVDVPACFLCVPRSPTRVKFCVVNAWICACQTTDRDFESVFVKTKVNAWICAPTHHRTRSCTREKSAISVTSLISCGHFFGWRNSFFKIFDELFSFQK